MEATNLEIRAVRSLGAGRAMAIIVALTVVATGFLFYLIRMKPAVPEGSAYGAVIRAIPAFNAFFNATAAALIVAAVVAVRRRQYNRHMWLMFAALASSALFLVGYIIYHATTLEQRFAGVGVVRPIYFFILLTHIVLAPISLLMVLTSLWLSLAGRLAAHRRVSRWTFPIWLYVSVTGVLIFAMLKAYNG